MNGGNQKVVTTIAGHGVSGKAGRGFADGPAATSRLNTPAEVIATSGGTVYFSDTYGNRIRKITPQGIVSTVAGTGTAGLHDGPVGEAELNFPRGLVLWKKKLLLANFNNHIGEQSSWSRSDDVVHGYSAKTQSPPRSLPADFAYA